MCYTNIIIIFEDFWNCVDFSYLQELLAEYGLCFRGHRLPALKGRGKPVQKGEEEEETESDIFQRDIVEVVLEFYSGCYWHTWLFSRPGGIFHFNFMNGRTRQYPFNTCEPYRHFY